MFGLDMKVFNYIYSNCRQIGSIFGYGAFEGFIMYGGLISMGVLKFFENTKKLKK
ncbi:hypothetical protein [Clostridium sp. BL-8]|uniref:hypothetical protein n=1 Tax=Clostridium sp. BL-8 TaxID=349938 RepID=UPI0009D040ED|nr:hypothetical protein [Clostridium sp. BL-8]OOM78706.1 hypothetical protein CLOBL_21210 [Clostridium sp. BL-8]